MHGKEFNRGRPTHEGHVDECSLEASAANPATCTPAHACDAHAASHAHGPDCAHEPVPHAGHTDDHGTVTKG